MAGFILFENEKLGSGGYGTVYKCKWFGNYAAAKKLQTTETDIVKEIEILRRLHNDNIIQCFGMDYHEGKICLITSLAEKGSLYRALKEREVFPELKPGICTGVINGMVFLRRKEVIHRDLKSLNVLLDKNYVPKICDFGMAKLKENSMSLASRPRAIGTVRWLAPELLDVQPKYSYQSDVYALGVVLWEIQTEKTPYAEIEQNDIILNLIRTGKTEEIPSHIPKHYREMIKKCWYFNPKRRITVEKLQEKDQEMISPSRSTTPVTVFDQKIPSSVANPHSTMPNISPHSLGISETFRKLRKTVSSIDLRQITTHIKDVKDSNGRLALGKNWFKPTGIERQDSGTSFGEVQTNSRDALQNHPIETGPSVQQTNVQDLSDIHYSETVRKSHGHCVSPTYLRRGLKTSMRASENLDPESQFKIAKELESDGSLMNAVAMYEKAANQNHIQAQFKLGTMYQDGKGVEIDLGMAAFWFKSAAEQGCREAKRSLGRMFQEGQGVAKDYATAVRLFMEAAKQGSPQAQFDLAGMYRNGLGVEQDQRMANHWYVKAAEQHHIGAQMELRYLGH